MAVPRTTTDFFCHLNSGLTPKYLAAVAIVTVAALIRRQCYHSLGHMFTFDLSIKKDHRLVQTGPYAIVRHPAYAAFALLNCGVMMTHFGAVSGILYVLPPWFGLNYNRFIFWASAWGLYTFTSRASLEDQVLREEFGEEWVAWASKVRCKFIPGIW